MQAIMNYNSEKATEHMVGMWLRSDPKDPVKQLTIAFKEVDMDDVTQCITVLLSSIKYGKKHKGCEFCDSSLTFV